MKLLLMFIGGLLIGSVGSAEESYIEVVHKRSSTPVQLSIDSTGAVFVTCTEGSQSIDRGSEVSPGNTKMIEEIPTGGSVDPANEDCETPQHEELWLTRADGSSFMAYQKTCLDDASAEDNFGNGGRVYYVGDVEIDKEIRKSVSHIRLKMTMWKELTDLFGWCSN